MTLCRVIPYTFAKSGREAEMTESKRFDLGTVIDDARRVLLDTPGFYGGMARGGGYAEPLIFIVVMGVAAGVVAAVGSILFGGFRIGMGMGLGAVIALPIMAVIGSFIGGAIMFMVWRLMGGTENYETAWRCIAYSFAAWPVMMLAQWIPYIGSIVSAALFYWLMYHASVQVHGIAADRSRLVIGVLGVVMLLMNFSSERSARLMEERAEALGRQLQGQFQDLENMSPGEAGEAVGQFLKGLEKGANEP